VSGRSRCCRPDPARGHEFADLAADSEKLAIDVFIVVATIVIGSLVGLDESDEPVADAVLVRRARDALELVREEQVEQDVAHHLLTAVLLHEPRFEPPRIGEEFSSTRLVESLEATREGDDVHDQERAAVVEVLAGITDARIHRAG
jgi:hypothetical protein